MPQAPDSEHYGIVAKRILDGAVVPFLGAGVNLCDRPPSVTEWERGTYLPSGAELAAYLAKEVVDYPYADLTDLLRVSQYLDVNLGSGPLYEALHNVFDVDYLPTRVHTLLASLPALIRAHPRGRQRLFPLIVTTNYDDALERAFQQAGEPYDLVTYVANGPDKGKFIHIPPGGGEPILIAVPNAYGALRCDEWPVIAKIHGAVDRGPSRQDSFVITENHYIAYLNHTNITELIPVNIAFRMKRSHFLFLGYSLRDWNLRVILHRIWGDAELTFNSWAIQPSPDRLEEKSWPRRGVELLDIRLEEYIERLRQALEEVDGKRAA